MRMLMGIMLIFLMFRTPVWAAGIDAVVKVESHLCGRNDHKFRGSGVLIRANNHTYVLTSDHVVIAANEPYCHSIHFEDGQAHDVRLVAHDWGYGLALLEAQSQMTQAIDLDDFISSHSLSSGMTATTVGFPSASMRRLIDRNAQIAVSQSDSNQLLELSHSIEVLGHGEFGMSGGALIADDRLAGILSHQFLELSPGHASPVRDYSPDHFVLENHLVIIPGEIAKEWLLKVTREMTPPSFILDANAQFLGVTKVTTQGVTFSLTRNRLGCDSKTSTGIGGPDGAGIGGADGAGIGGIDGAGIGGESSGEKNSCFAIALSYASMSANLPLHSLSIRSFLVDLRELLLRKRTSVIPYLIRNQEKIQVRSLGQFFKELAVPGTKPLVIGDLDDVTSESRANVRRQAELLKSNLRVLVPILSAKMTLDPSAPDLLSAKVLLRRIDVLADVLAHDGWALVDSKELKKLGEDEAWKVIFGLDQAFDASVESLSTLRSIYKFLVTTKL